MPVSCQCPACKKTFQIGDKHAGHRCKCPLCGGIIQVPGPPRDTPLPVAKAIEPPAKPSAKPPAKPAAKPPARPAPARRAVTNLPLVDAGDTSATSPVTPRHHKRSGNHALLIVGGAMAGGMALVVIAVLAVVVWQRSKEGSNRPVARAKRAQEASPNSSLTEAFTGTGDKGALVLDWPDDQRAGARVDINGRQMKLPEAGTLKYHLAPGQQRVLIRRRGYELIEVSLVVDAGDELRYRPEFQRLTFAGAELDASKVDTSAPPSFDDWEQDFDLAQRRAAAEGKDILLVFDGSDWCGYSIQMANDVFFHPDFPTTIGAHYVPVLIDFPRGSTALSQVQNMSRNERLAGKFGVSGFPTLFVTDAQGRPYAAIGYERGGLSGFERRLAGLQDVKQKRNALFAAVDSAPAEEKLRAAEAAHDYLQQQKLTQHYDELYRQWFALAEQLDADNGQGLNEVFFEVIWQLTIYETASADEGRLPELAGRLDAWKQQHQFQDGDRAARLHLQAAALVVENDPPAAARYATAGLSYKPDNDEVQQALSRLEQIAESLNILGSGSGFVVAEGGYIVTNHHVIEGPGRVMVQLPGRDDPISARIVARDAKEDLALLKADIPADVQLQVMPVSATAPNLGQELAAFGFPLGKELGQGLKFAKCGVGGESKDGMILLDGKINPGNSGGPLCGSGGQVVGVVTAKTMSSLSVESYGMAVPGATLQDFLEAHLPNYEPPSPDDQTVASDAWDQVAAHVRGSVLMILKMR